MVSTSWRPNSSAVTAPKLPPPPRRAQNKSSFSCSLAVRIRPSAVTTSAPTRLSHERPRPRVRYPMPPPRVRPATPVVETTPPVVASPYACVAWLKSPHVAPPPARAVFLAGSTNTLFRSERSRATPSSQVPNPGTLWPPPRTAKSRALSPREVDRGDSVGGRRGSHDDRRSAIVHEVVHAPMLVVVVVARLDHRTPHLLPQLRNRRHDPPCRVD